MFLSRKLIRRLVKEDEGLTATEYATILALIVIVCINASLMLGKGADRVFTNLANRMLTFNRD